MVRKFATTNWRLVLATRTEHSERRREALSGLCELYWFPLYAFIRRRGHSPDEAADLTQAFFLHLIEKHALASADPSLGRFRGFLLVSLKHFLANEHERRTALRRGGGRVDLPLDLDDLERRYRTTTTDASPERLFDRQWALTMIERALDRLRTQYRGDIDRAREFEVLSVFLTEESAANYSEAAARLQKNEGAVRTAVHRLRRRYGEALRQEVAETLGDPGEVDAELRFLFSALEP